MIVTSPTHLFASPLEGEVDSAKRWREGGMPPPSHYHRPCGNSTTLPDLRSDLPLKGGGDEYGDEAWKANPP